ncbi:MAG TPA: hypothetical protein VGZ68_10640, partial [Acidimicrobiales bacterium]|nr:hypothetical protein [Acidimicrobiales bacterium]
MIRFGFRLTIRGGKESMIRLVVMALAVSVGVAMLLLTMATINGLGRQNARGAWMATTPSVEVGNPHFGHRGSQVTAPATSAPIWWLVSSQDFEGQLVVRVDVASTGHNALVPPGIAHLPGPGQYYASPALAALLKTTPAAQLGDRFAGTQIGTIGPAALPSPKDLVIVDGQSVKTLSKIVGAGTITSFVTSSGSGGPDSSGTTGLQIILAVLALVLLFPV